MCFFLENIHRIESKMQNVYYMGTWSTFAPKHIHVSIFQVTGNCPLNLEPNKCVHRRRRTEYIYDDDHHHDAIDGERPNMYK